MSLKSTGIVRKVDELGRIVLPIELRRTLNIAERDTVEIFVDGASIVLKKYVPETVKAGRGKKNICDICKREMDKG
jgi:transcriptional pleiotropic regulator of transition state genes